VEDAREDVLLMRENDFLLVQELAPTVHYSPRVFGASFSA
jgi:hypothetical protein